jgi:F-type H+-transporting ATPase subunit b
MNRRWLRAFCLCLAFVLSAGVAWAAPATDAHASDKVNIFAPAIDLGIWTLVVFLLLMFILKKFAWGPMLEGLHKRETNIRAAIDEATRTRDDAKRIQGELQKQMDNAAGRVRELLDEARKDAQQLKEDMTASARKEIQEERDRQRREIEMAKDQALQQIWQESAQLATMISSKAIRRQLTVEDHRRLVDEALGELRKSGQQRQREVAGVRA